MSVILSGQGLWLNNVSEELFEQSINYSSAHTYIHSLWQTLHTPLVKSAASVDSIFLFVLLHPWRTEHVQNTSDHFEIQEQNVSEESEESVVFLQNDQITKLQCSKWKYSTFGPRDPFHVAMLRSQITSSLHFMLALSDSHWCIFRHHLVVNNSLKFLHD